MWKKIIFMALFILITFSLTACQDSAKTADGSTIDAEEYSAENISKLDIMKMDGTELSMQNLLSQAELTVFNVWSPSCDDCLEEMKTLNRLSAQYSGRGVQIVGIAKGVYQKQDTEALAVMNEAGTFYTQLLDSEELEKQLSGLEQKPPFTILAARDGRQLKVISGAQDKDYWESELDKYHKEVCIDDHPADCAVG